jgi:hypothetical protein
LNVGTEDEKGHGLKLFNHNKKEQEDDHRDASLSQAIAEAHPFSADSRQKVIGQYHDLFLGGGEALLELFGAVGSRGLESFETVADPGDQLNVADAVAFEFAAVGVE